jgi:hypothetical protein
MAGTTGSKTFLPSARLPPQVVEIKADVWLRLQVNRVSLATDDETMRLVSSAGLAVRRT